MFYCILRYSRSYNRNISEMGNYRKSVRGFPLQPRRPAVDIIDAMVGTVTQRAQLDGALVLMLIPDSRFMVCFRPEMGSFLRVARFVRLCTHIHQYE